jgi:hypothetical protein
MAVWAGCWIGSPREQIISVQLVPESCVGNVGLDLACCISGVCLPCGAHSLCVECNGVPGQVWRQGFAEVLDHRFLVPAADLDVLDVLELECLLCCLVCCLIARYAHMTWNPIEHGFLVSRVAVIQELVDGSKQEMVVCWSVLLDNLEGVSDQEKELGEGHLCCLKRHEDGEEFYLECQRTIWNVEHLGADSGVALVADQTGTSSVSDKIN